MATDEAAGHICCTAGRNATQGTRHSDRYDSAMAADTHCFIGAHSGGCAASRRERREGSIAPSASLLQGAPLGLTAPWRPPSGCARLLPRSTGCRAAHASWRPRRSSTARLRAILASRAASNSVRAGTASPEATAIGIAALPTSRHHEGRGRQPRLSPTTVQAHARRVHRSK